MTDTSVILTALIGGGGGAGVLGILVTGIVKWVNGSAAREKSRNITLAAQRDRAVVERDDADVYRRVVAEYASELIRLLRVNGIPHPPFPSNPNSKETIE